MTVTDKTNAERVSRRLVDKFGQRRDELATAALVTLGDLGYARTSLREIAQNSDFSHGVLHYYFSDKIDLITHGVRLYKAQCVTRYDEIVASSETSEELATGFADAMVSTLHDDAAMHRLWYDLRSQSMFDEALRTDVAAIDLALEQMVWRVVTRYRELAGADLSVSSAYTYALFDGVFQQALIAHVFSPGSADAALRERVHATLTSLERMGLPAMPERDPSAAR